MTTPSEGEAMLGQRIVAFINANDPFGDQFCAHDVKRIEAHFASAAAQSSGVREATRVARIEQVAEIILDGYRTNSEGMIINEHDLARSIVDAMDHALSPDTQREGEK